MKRIAALCVLLVAGFARADDDTAIRVRVALALAAAQQVRTSAPQPPADPLADYHAAYQQSLASGWPLVVFVGIPYRTLPGKVVTCDVPAFPDAPGPCVVVAVPKGGVIGDGVRLAGYPTDEQIMAALKPKPTHSDAVAKWLAQPLNQGNCPCGQTGAGCHCQPHQLCSQGQCANHNPLLSAAKPAAVTVPQRRK